MNDYGNMLLIAMPIFLLLILVEMFWGRIKHGEQQPVIDTISSLSSGMTNILKSTLGISIVIISYPWMVEHLQVIQLEKGSIWPYVITFVFMDFTGYWMHRLQHRVNFFWNHHIIHHSSEEFNLPCALRQQIAVMTNIYTLVMLPLALLGIPGEVLALVGPIHLFSQFWYHTRYIGNLGILEYILVTPSHHSTPCHERFVFRQKLQSDFHCMGSVVWHLSGRTGNRALCIWHAQTRNYLEPLHHQLQASLAVNRRCLAYSKPGRQISHLVYAHRLATC
ncbi:MAG: sterol desaturase family protein [Bacteroidetes bacterium]|nr:sterol desaturase family protein [Bacteroidota bacterium]